MVVQNLGCVDTRKEGISSSSMSPKASGIYEIDLVILTLTLLVLEQVWLKFVTQLIRLHAADA